MQALNQAIECAGQWVWENSVAGSILILLVWGLQAALGKLLPPRWQYGLWLLVAVRLLLPLAPSAPCSIFNVGHLWPKHVATQPAVEVGIPSGLAGGIATSDKTVLPMEKRLPSKATAEKAPSMGRLLGWLWLLGSFSYLGIVLWQQRRLTAWAKRQEPSRDPQLQRLLDECKESLRLNRNLEVITTERFSVPTLFGFRRPRLLLPLAILEQPDLLKMVLLHELVHLKRNHVPQNWALVLLQALHWFNPAVWFAFKRLRTERELACDAIVLSVLKPGEHHAYGTALLKIMEMNSKPLLMLTVVPIVNNHHQIHRRITMIAEFKTTRRLAIIPALILACVAALTFTGASGQNGDIKPAEKQKETRPTREKPARDVPPRAEAADADKLKNLQKELDVITQQVREAQQRADKLKEELGIPDYMPQGNEQGLTVLRQLERERILAQANYQEVASLHRELAIMPQKELRKTIPTASPDPILISLLQNLATAEQNLAESTETYGPEHTEVRRKKKILETIDKQVAERIEGILEGLKTKSASYKAKVDFLQEELERAKKAEIVTAIKSRPYQDAKRELETLQGMQERLRLRIMQEKIDR